jgi:hypothetical protein
VAWVVACVILAGACGTSGDKKSSSTTTKPRTTTTQQSTTTAPPETTSTTEPDDSTTTKPASPGDQARVSAVNIVAADFPAGWTSTPSTPDGGAKLFQTCAPSIDLEGQTLAKGDSAEFTRKLGQNETRAASSTRLLSDENVATTVTGTFADTAFVSCVEKTIKDSGLKEGTATGKLTAQPISGLGDQAAGIDGTVAGTDSGTGQQAQLGVSIIAIRTGNLVTVLTGAALGQTQPTDGALFQKLAEAIANRQKQA